MGGGWSKEEIIQIVKDVFWELEKQRKSIMGSTNVMNSPQSTTQTSGFHILELHGGTMSTMIQVLLGLLVALIMAKGYYSYRQRQKRKRSEWHGHPDVSMPYNPTRYTPTPIGYSEAHSRRSDKDVQREFVEIIMPMIAREREDFTRIIGAAPRPIRAQSRFVEVEDEMPRSSGKGQTSTAAPSTDPWANVPLNPKCSLPHGQV